MVAARRLALSRMRLVVLLLSVLWLVEQVRHFLVFRPGELVCHIVFSGVYSWPRLQWVLYGPLGIQIPYPAQRR